jgi:hypothetical protein
MAAQPDPATADLSTATVPAVALGSDYLTPAELAPRLGVSERTLMRWHAARRGPPRIMYGRQIRYRWPSVENWIRKQERDFDEQPPAGSRRRPAQRRVVNARSATTRASAAATKTTTRR